MILTEQRQKRAIRNMIDGRKIGVEPDDLDDYFYYLYGYIKNYREAGHDGQDILQDVLRLKTTNPDLLDIIEDITTMDASPQSGPLELADISEDLKDIEFFWERWLPRGYPTILGAWPAVGKTYFALDIARRVIENKPAPDGVEFKRRTGKVVYVDAEDMIREVWARAKAWGMTGRGFYPIRRPPRRLIDLNDKFYQDELIDMCYDVRPDLVIVDSFSSAHLGGESAIEDVRELILFLDQLARSFDMAEIVIHHPRKPPAGITQPITMHDMRGSGYLSQISRLIIGMDVVKSGPDDDPNGPRRLRVIKSNFSSYPKPIGVFFDGAKLNPQKAELSYNQENFFAPTPTSLTTECARWLLEILAEEPIAYKDLKVLAVEFGYSETTLQDAKKELNGRVKDTLGKQRKGNKWCVAEEETEESEESED